MQEANAKVIEKMDSGKKAATKNGEARKIVGFVGEVKQELKRVEWTSKEDLKTYTKMVLLSTFLFALFIYLADLSIQGILEGINYIITTIFG